MVSDVAVHAFDYFRYQICAKYIERGYPILWATSSISIGLQEPAVFYAIAALSTIERALVQTIHTTLARPVDKQMWDLAMQMYCKALECLRHPMQKAIRGQGSLEPIILSCLSFLVFEVTTGNHLNAIRHARVGKSILDERLNRRDGSPRTSSSCAEASSVFEGIQAKRNFGVTSRDCGHLTRFVAAKASFGSLEEARAHLEILTEAGQDIRGQLIRRAQDSAQTARITASASSRFCLQYTLSRIMTVDVALLAQLDDLMNGFGCWGRSFGRMFRSGQFISQDLFIMQLRFFYASFTLAICRETDERLTNRFEDQFVRTLESAERLLRSRPVPSPWRAEETMTGPVAVEFMHLLDAVDGTSLGSAGEDALARPQIGPSPTHEDSKDRAVGVFEFGVLHALFAIACKCRRSSRRRRAARLLSEAKRTEAINSSGILLTYAEMIIHLEEQQAAQLTGQLAVDSDFYADEVPEQARFLDVVASSISGKAGHFVLSCTRRAFGKRGDVELLEYECGDKLEECRLARLDLIRADHSMNEWTRVGQSF